MDIFHKFGWMGKNGRIDPLQDIGATLGSMKNYRRIDMSGGIRMSFPQSAVYCEVAYDMCDVHSWFLS
ncbi:MAG: hypothetical protein SPF89_09610 [Sphaerochaetaceae bacterium]|nr:hypothetical protein [Spirochaetales bacterium]MDY5500347.1 hypothetical protein [Sphaerochaetaceae bacterium]